MKNVKTLSLILQRDSNNFDLIRLLAAIMVMLGHSYAIQNPSGNIDFIRRYFFPDYPGSIAVYIFFFISGILITQSWERLQNPIFFVAHRIARIWPGLIVNILITIFMIGPFVTYLPSVREYLLNDYTLYYLITNIFHIGGFEARLPGVFGQGGGLKDVVNYPLWSLPVEAQCYFVVGVLGVIGLLAKPKKAAITLAILSVVFLIATIWEPYWPFTIWFLHRDPIDYSSYPPLFFFAGILCYSFQKKIMLDWRLMACLIGIAIFLRRTEIFVLGFGVALGYSVLMVSSISYLGKIRPKHDYSYGIYIYGFICQQIIAQVWPDLSGYWALSLALLLTLVFASFSCHLIEEPSIRFIKRYSSPL